MSSILIIITIITRLPRAPSTSQGIALATVNEGSITILFRSSAAIFFFMSCKLNIVFAAMPEYFCLRWNDFKENFQSTFMFLKDDKDYADVTLASDDGQLLKAHKVILAASSPFLETILQENDHAHPILYLKGFQTKDLNSILEFIYQGNSPCMK